MGTESFLQFSRDEYGREVLLKEGKFQVMMEWERPYMHACIDALYPSGDVLEVGFGCGYAAERIQTYKPRSHTIIECDPVVATRAKEFAAQHTGVRIIEATWQLVLPSLGVFDTLFFDDYPLESGETMQKWQTEAKLADTLLHQGADLLEEVKSSLPFLQQIHYSQQEVGAFVEEQSRLGISNASLARFVGELAERGQIDLQTKEVLFSSLEWQELPPTTQPPHRSERFYLFLEQVLARHVRLGSRISCFLESAQSKVEDPLFCDKVIANPHLDYEERRIPVHVPDNCQYYKDKEALVISIIIRSL